MHAEMLERIYWSLKIINAFRAFVKTNQLLGNNDLYTAKSSEEKQQKITSLILDNF